jgi:5-methylcytosine-specific restriction endonuclease McrA
VTHRDSRGAIAFAEKVLELLDEGRRTATYKFALLLALIDLSLELTKAAGAPPDFVTTRQVAEKIVEIYWHHTLPFAVPRPPQVLRQNTGRQAEIVSAIERFRERHATDSSVPRWESQHGAPEAYERLIGTVEWKLIEMPIPRLQMIGQVHEPFIYEIHWDTSVQRRIVADYLAGRGAFDNRLLFRPSVGEYLRQLNGLLRPLIQRRWASMVAQLNRLAESQLDDFLFGVDRIPTMKVRVGLWEIQNGRCFYCETRVGDLRRTHVDHFIPWARYPDNGLANLVVADTGCNGQKSNSLAAADHVARWSRRFRSESSEQADLAALATQATWERSDDRTLSVARAIYYRLPDNARLWLRGREFVIPDRVVIEEALASTGDSAWPSPSRCRPRPSRALEPPAPPSHSLH